MYRLTETTTVIRLADGASIPADPENRDWRDYVEWLDGGGVPEPVVLPDPGIPQVVTRFQARAALELSGLLGQVEALMADADLPALQRLAWTDAAEFRRQSPTLLAMADLLNLDSQQIDDLFTLAAGIEA